MGAFKEMPGLAWLGSDTLLGSTSHRWGTYSGIYDRYKAFWDLKWCL